MTKILHAHQAEIRSTRNDIWKLEHVFFLKTDGGCMETGKDTVSKCLRWCSLKNDLNFAKLV